jgi:hypothetical protein
MVAAIEGGVPALVKASEMVVAFHVMIRRKGVADLAQWIDRSCDTLVASFVGGIVKDIAAVGVAIACHDRMVRPKARSPSSSVRNVRCTDARKSTCFKRASSAPPEPQLRQICAAASAPEPELAKNIKRKINRPIRRCSLSDPTVR